MRADADRPNDQERPRAPRQARGTGDSSRALTGLQVEGWRLLWQQLLRDPDALAECRIWEERRRRAAPEMLALLQRFVGGAADLEEFRSAVDQGTRAEWDAFGMRGASGAMLLNRLAKYAPRPERASALLRHALALPADDSEARARLGELAELFGSAGPSVVDLAEKRPPQAPALQPARAAFFASVWWHLQDTERWPVFQPSARRALREEQDVFVPTGEPLDDYFAFRDAFHAVAAALRTSAWELEYLCWWRQQRAARDSDEIYYEPGTRRAAPAVVREPRPTRVTAIPTPAPVGTSQARGSHPGLHHTQVQWVLARLGRKLGCRVWVAANDRSRSWEGQLLGDLSVRRLPSLGLSAASQRVVSLIDVVWLRGANEVAAAFEIEHTTSVYSGLLRLADLAALSPNLSFPLYIVAPRSRLEKVRRELSRPALQALGLHRRCAFLSGEALLDAAESIMRWATDPSAIEKLASRADDLSVGERAD